ncbi:MAG: hypothetical protein EHM58_07680 [Ignavibacteriae bacterium]|nr:MAG: hypothetical protein EHM58_07680 [Ignavibacteriota bacterium]
MSKKLAVTAYIIYNLTQNMLNVVVLGKIGVYWIWISTGLSRILNVAAWVFTFITFLISPAPSS